MVHHYFSKRSFSLQDKNLKVSFITVFSTVLQSPQCDTGVTQIYFDSKHCSFTLFQGTAFGNRQIMEHVSVSAGDSVLWLWDGTAPSVDLQEAVKSLQERLQGGRVQMEHLQRLKLGEFFLLYHLCYIICINCFISITDQVVVLYVIFTGFTLSFVSYLLCVKNILLVSYG